ncbi:MAG TPA: type II secretion system protein N [Cellvibrio sp.]|nr:type II secretion system protein N [Cellvibrio sp.]
MMSPSRVLPKLNASKKFWITLGVFVWLYCVAINLPAIWGAYALTRGSDVAMSGVSGTLWSGRASLVSVKIKGLDQSIGQLTWKLDIFSLVTLRPCALITTKMDSQQFDGYVCIKGKRGLIIKDATVSFPSALVQPMLPLALGGQFSLTIEQLEIADSRLQKLHGKATWIDGKIYNGSNWMSLGSIGADMADDGKNGLNSHIVDISGPLQIDLKGNLPYPTGARITGNLAMPESYFRETNAGAWLSMFAVQQANDDQGNIVYAVDLNL